MSNPYCPTCSYQLDDSDHAFEVWVCPHCDEIVPEPEQVSADDLPEAP